jgi:hypothetical protein
MRADALMNGGASLLAIVCNKKRLLATKGMMIKTPIGLKFTEIAF